METGKMELREAVIRTIAMPSDTNPAGDIFGGWLMAQMDLAAGNAAARRARGRCVTVAVDGMTFHSPVHVGDEVSVYAELISTGRTSMKFRVEVLAPLSRRRRADQGDRSGLHVRGHRQRVTAPSIADRMNPRGSHYTTPWAHVSRPGEALGP